MNQTIKPITNDELKAINAQVRTMNKIRRLYREFKQALDELDFVDKSVTGDIPFWFGMSNVSHDLLRVDEYLNKEHARIEKESIFEI